jgi:ribosomal protein S6
MWQMRFAAPAGAVQELDRLLKLNESVLRHVVTNRRHEREGQRQAANTPGQLSMDPGSVSA